VSQSLKANCSTGATSFRPFLDAVPGGVSWINSDLEYLGINSRLAATFGLKPEDFVGKQIGFLQSSPDFSSFVTDFVRSAERSAAREVDMTIDGERRVYLLMAQKLSGGQSSVFVGIDITDRKAAEEKLFRDAFFDKLTGLPNRSLLLERMERALEYSKRREGYLFAVLFLDFDGFKHVNDSLGHTVGDHLLKAVARRLETLVRSADTVARLGGDEFVLLLDDIDDLSRATQIAERVQRSMATPFPLQGRIFSLQFRLELPSTLRTITKPRSCFVTLISRCIGPKPQGATVRNFQPSDARRRDSSASNLNRICTARSMRRISCCISSRFLTSRPKSSIHLKLWCAGTAPFAGGHGQAISLGWPKRLA
jgi:diguanylate cyclase (GGDEF)-like protein/PAS domain S-box-containing protein